MADAIQNEFKESRRNSEVMAAFGYRLHNAFTTNASYRRPKELEWLEDLRQYKGLYDPDVKIETNASKVYPKLTRSKVNIVLSRLHEMLFPSNERNWNIEPTPDPRISKDVVTQIALSLVQQDPQTGQPVIPTADELQAAISEYVRTASEKMRNQIDDQLLDMGYSEETKKVLRSGLIYGTGIMKGPMIHKREKHKWEPDTTTGEYVESATNEELPYYEFVRVWDWYPDMTVTDIDKLEGSFQRHVMNKHDLRQMMKRPDFYADVIKTYMEAHPEGDYVAKNWEVDLQVIEVEAGAGKDNRTTTTVTGTSDDLNRSTNRQLGKRYEILEYWGYVDGTDLEACGVDMAGRDVELEYAAHIWLLGKHVISAALFNEALDEYKVFYYEKDETSIFGEGLARIMRHSQLAIAGAARMTLDNGACLTGDTEVYRNHRSSDRPTAITLSELWKTKHKHNSGLRRMKIRSVNEETGEIFYNRIVDIYNNGTRPVYEVKTLHGYCVRATDDHKFMSDDGEWTELSGFCIGDNIAVNGRTSPPPLTCKDCGTKISRPGALRCRKCAAKIENSTWNARQAEGAATNTTALKSTARQRWACQKDKKDCCERCGAKESAGVRLGIHHIDGNPYNNDPSNKITCCQPCHMFIHRRHDYFGQPKQHTFIDYDEIVSIEYVGDEEVFDLELTAPNHNFIANGFVVHNCVAGPQVELNWSLLAEGQDMSSFHPRKIWWRKGTGVEAQYPAVRGLEFASHIEELIAIANFFKQFADEETCLPTWIIGQMVSNETAQASSGRQATITISIKDVVRNFDAFTEKIIAGLYNWNMEFNPRQDIKGDYEVKATGSISLVMKEIRMQALNQFAQTLTPEDWDYFDRRDFLAERMRVHDINLRMKSEPEAQKAREQRENSKAQQLVYAQMEADVAYTKAQTMAQLTKAKQKNVEAVKMAQEPPEGQETVDPRMQDAELLKKQEEINALRQKQALELEKHEAELQTMMQKSEQERTKAHVQTALDVKRAVQDTEIKQKESEHGMKVREKAAMIKAKQKPAAKTASSTAKKPAKGAKK